jgi:hypothetical protein
LSFGARAIGDDPPSFAIAIVAVAEARVSTLVTMDAVAEPGPAAAAGRPRTRAP